MASSVFVTSSPSGSFCRRAAVQEGPPYDDGEEYTLLSYKEVADAFAKGRCGVLSVVQARLDRPFLQPLMPQSESVLLFICTQGLPNSSEVTVDADLVPLPRVFLSVCL